MTGRELSQYLNVAFPSWRVKEHLGYLQIGIPRHFSMEDAKILAHLEDMKPAGVVFSFYTLGFFEKFLCRNGRWSTYYEEFK